MPVGVPAAAPSAARALLTHRARLGAQEHVDYLAVQALLFQREGLTIYKATRLMYRYKHRIAED